MADIGDDAVRDVLVVERAQFVATRDARAAELRRAGRTEEADHVRALRKPSVALWALLVLAQERSGTLDALAEAIAAVRAALGGRGDPRAAQDDLQARLRDAMADARSLATEHGERVSDATAERIAGILRAAIASPGVLGELRRGVLSEEPEADGFASVADLPRAPRSSSKPGTKRAAAAAEKRRRRREMDAIERRLAAARRKAGAARRRADDAVAEAEQAEAEAQSIEAELSALRDAV